MKLTNKTYDILKWIALVALDALGLLYSTLATIWGLPYGDEIMKTCAALSLCLGTLIGVSSVQYKRMLEDKGTITFLNPENYYSDDEAGENTSVDTDDDFPDDKEEGLENDD